MKKNVEPHRLEKKLENVLHHQESGIDINGELLRARMPIHFGGMSDPFACKGHTAITLEILSILERYNYPLVLSTKNTEEMLRDDVINVMKKLRFLTVQVSAPIPDDKLSRVIEPGAPVFSRRLRHLKILHNEGLNVVVRLQPILPPLLNRICKEAIPAFIEAGCKHIILECLKIPLEKSRAINRLFKTINWDGHEYYQKRGGIIVGRDLVLPPKIAWHQITELLYILNKNGITYGTNDHGLFHFGNTSCCCGVADRAGFGGWFKANFTNIIRNTRSSQLSFADVTRQWIPEKSIARYINSNCRLPGDNTVMAHLRDKWNKPGHVSAPDSFLGVKYTGLHDKNGNCLYEKSEVKNFYPI